MTFLDKMMADGKATIYNPAYFKEEERQTQTWKSLVGQRLAFIRFHKFMSDLSDDAVLQLSNKYKDYVAGLGVNDRNSVYVDTLLLKTAIDYQIVIRNLRGDQSEELAEELAFEWARWCKQAQEYDEIDSDHLVSLLDDIFDSNQEKSGEKRLSSAELEAICVGLFGMPWQSQLARRFDIDPRTVQSWMKREPAKWVYAELGKLILLRKTEIDEAESIYRKI